MIRLARSVSPERPAYSFIAAGMEDGREPHKSIEEMASAYLAEIRTVQNSGPYYLSGHCLEVPRPWRSHRNSKPKAMQ